SVNPEQPSNFALYMRIPEWCNPGDMDIKVNGRPYPIVKPIEYATIRRTWKAGDKIELRLPATLQWVRLEHYQKTSDRKPYTTSEDNDAPWALQKGPLVYAVDNLYYKGDTSAFPKNVMNDVKYVLSDPARFSIVKAGKDMPGPGYKVPVQLADGKNTTIDVFPFANIGKWYKDAAGKPARDSK